MGDGSEDVFSIREVYYEDGTITMVSSSPISIESDSKESISWMLEKIQDAFVKDTIDLNSLEFWNK